MQTESGHVISPKNPVFAQYLKIIFKSNEEEENYNWIEPITENFIKRSTYIKKKISHDIKSNNNPKTALGFDIIGDILKQLSNTRIVKITHLNNAVLVYTFPVKVVMISKPQKSPNEVKSYTTFFLLSLI